MRARPTAVPAVAAALEPVGVAVLAAALPPAVLERRVAVLRLVSVAALAADRDLLRMAAPQVAPAVVQAFPVDQEAAAVSLVPVLDPAAGQAVIQVALALAPAVVQARPAAPRAAPVVSVAALRAVPEEVRPEDRPERLVQRVAAVAPQVMQAAARAMVEAGAAPAAVQRAADPVVDRGAGQAVVAQAMAQATAVPGTAVVVNAV